MAGGGEASIRPVGPGDVHPAFAQAAAEDGIVLASQSFDWLCEQGHVGLERVAKARRDPALVAPVTAALAARRDLRPPQGRRLGPARVAREPAAAGRPRARADRNRDRGRRLAALHVVPADGARALPAGRAVGFDLDEHKELCRAWCARTDGLERGLPRRASGSAGVPRERAYHDALRDLATPAMGHPPLSGSRPWTATARPPTAATGPRCSRSALPERAGPRRRSPRR